MFSDNQRNDPFASIDTADARGQRNPYFLAGQYHVRVEKVSHFESRESKLFWLVEFEILSSDNPDRPAGLKVSWMTNMRKDMGPINVKRFLAAINGIDPDSDRANQEVNGEMARLACSDLQPLKGMEIFAQCSDVKTRDGGDFLDIKWLPLDVAA